MATSKQGQQTPQASQFSYTGLSQQGLCYSPQPYTMNGIMNNAMPSMVNGVNGIVTSPPMYSQQSQPIPPLQPLQPLSEGGEIMNKILSRLDCIDTKL